jgi:hypothetical protein
MSAPQDQLVQQATKVPLEQQVLLVPLVPKDHKAALVQQEPKVL